jgi:hypothetical protein
MSNTSIETSEYLALVDQPLHMSVEPLKQAIRNLLAERDELVMTKKGLAAQITTTSRYATQLVFERDQLKKELHEADLHIKQVGRGLDKAIELISGRQVSVDARRLKFLDEVSDVSPYLGEYHSGVCLNMDAIDSAMSAKEVL